MDGKNSSVAGSEKSCATPLEGERNLNNRKRDLQKTDGQLKDWGKAKPGYGFGKKNGGKRRQA